MRSPDETDALWKPMSEPTPEFHIAVIYDTEEQAHRAERICRRLVEQFNGEFLFHIALCDFAGFEAAGGASPAIRQANRATLVVVAASTPAPRHPAGSGNGCMIGPSRRLTAVPGSLR